MIKVIVLLAFVASFCNTSKASHLLGGDLAFSCQGNNSYTFTLTIYRDILSMSGALHDNPAYLFVYNEDNGQLFGVYDEPLGNVIELPNNVVGECLGNAAPPQVDFAVYQFSGINLPPNTSGYRVVYQRCCRSENAANVNVNFDGFPQGSTYEVIINQAIMSDCGGAEQIPSFGFQSNPPTQLCSGSDNEIDQHINEAILEHVDSVVYTLCAPYNGGSGSECIIPDPLATGNCTDFNPQCSEPCTYNEVEYYTGHSAINPFGPASSIEFDQETGIININPNVIGQYVVGWCVTAYKNGEVWARIARDFQYNVYDCIQSCASPPTVRDGELLDPVTIDSIGEIDNVFRVCNDLVVEFVTADTMGNDVRWDFGIVGRDDDISTDLNPVFTYPDTGTFLVQYILNPGLYLADTAYLVLTFCPDLADPVSSTSLHELNIAATISPIPFTDQTTFNLAKPLSFKYDLQLIDILGREVRRYERHSTNNVVIERGNLQPGIFFLNLTKSGDHQVLKTLQLIIGR